MKAKEWVAKLLPLVADYPQLRVEMETLLNECLDEIKLNTTKKPNPLLSGVQNMILTVRIPSERWYSVATQVNKKLSEKEQFNTIAPLATIILHILKAEDEPMVRVTLDATRLLGHQHHPVYLKMQESYKLLLTKVEGNRMVTQVNG